MLSFSMRALVTGGHGFIGTHLVRHLLDGGAEVRCLVRSPGRPAALEGLEVEIVRGDLRHTAGLADAMQGVGEVYHLAGLTSSLTRSAMFATNLGGTRRLLEAAARAGQVGRFVHCSSMSVTGPAQPGSTVDEATPCRPLTWYGESKAAAEALALGLAGDVPLTVVRPPGVYGPRDQAFLPLFQAAAQGFALVTGRPTKRYSLIHATDLAAALVAAARAEATRGRVYFATHPEVVTLLDIVEAAEQAVDRQTLRLAVPESLMRLIGRVVDLGSQWTGRSSVLGSQRMREVATGDWACSGQALARDAGWVAEIPLVRGFAQTVAAYREAGVLRA